jgi:leucyl-tRNA synthetase
MNHAIKSTEEHYENMMFREALKCGYYDLQSARDAYRLQCGGLGEEGNMHAELVKRFIEVSTLLLAPFCPHTCEHVWGALLGKPGTVTKAGFPTYVEPDKALMAAARYLDDLVSSIRKGVAKATAPPKKKGAGPPPPIKTCDAAHVFVAEKFGGWQEVCLGILAEKYDASANAFPPVNEVLDAVKASELSKDANFKNVMKMVMPFIKFKQDEAKAVGEDALSVRLIFDEAGVLNENAAFIAKACGLKAFAVFSSAGDALDGAAAESVAAATSGGVKVDAATPGAPAVYYITSTAAEDIADGVAKMEV